jgi:integrase
MALYKRKDSVLWWVRISIDGREVRRTTGTPDKREAQEFEAKLKAEVWRESRMGERPRYRWEQAVTRWLTERAFLPSIEDQKIHLRWLRPHLDGRFLTDITRDVLDNVARARKADGVSNASVNRVLEVARAILRCAAREWGWIDAWPAVRMLPEPKRRIRWLTREEADRVLVQLPGHIAEMVRFSLATGLRRGNVVDLEWSQVDLTRRIAWFHHDQTKNKKALSVPLNAEAVLVLRRQEGKHATRVFTYRPRTKQGKPPRDPRPVEAVNTKAWRKALTRAGIKDFRWHDLRHTWASWHVQSGTPLQVLQELGGWSSYEMVLKYAHLSAGHLADFAEALCRPRAVTRTFSGTAETEVTSEVS